MAEPGGSERRWRQVQELFAAAVDLPATERLAFLESSGSDEAVRAEVEALLASDQVGGTFLETAIAAGTALLEANTDPLAGRARVGKYELIERIGAGGFGAVWRGRDTLLQRSVAIKSCNSDDPKLRQRFLREAQIVAALQHPHVTTVYDFGQQDGIPYLVQELLPGEDLAEKIRRREPMSLLERLGILRQVASALAYAHGQGVLHRDVKPSNVRILPDGTAKLMDFGVAKALHDDSSGLTSEGVALGTMGYIAPEQLRGRPPDRRSDVFAFGVLAYELLAYRRPFLGGSFSEISMRLLEEPAPPLAEHCPGCPAGVVTLVEHCLAKDPADRWQGFEPLVASLDALIAALEEGQPPPTLPDFAPTKRLDVSTLPVPTVRRPVALLGIAALLAAVLAVALPRWLRERPQSLGAEPAPTATAASTGAPAPPAGAGDAGGAQTPPPATGAEAGAEAAVPAAGGAPSAPRREPPRAVVASRPTVQAPIGPAAAGRGGSPSPPPAAAPRAPDPAATKTTDAAPATEAPPPAKASPAVSPPAVGGSAAAPSAGTVVHPRLLIRPVPDYPDEARRRRAVGRVELLVLVNETGKVVNTVVKNETPAGLGFAREAREAATRAAFAPATRDGQPGTDWTELVFDFHPP